MTSINWLLMCLVIGRICAQLPLIEQVSDDEDDLLMDMPQNGPDEGSGLQDLFDDTQTTKPAPTTVFPSITIRTRPAAIIEGKITSSQSPNLESDITVEPTGASSTATAPEQSGLSKAALTGIIIAIIVAIVLIAIIIVYVVKRSKRDEPGRCQQRTSKTTRGRQQVPQEV